MFKRSLLILSALALFGAGCFPVGNSPTPEAPPVDTSINGIIRGNWKMRTMKLGGGTTKEVSDLTLLVGFDGQNMNAKICNSMSGAYTVNNVVLKAPQVMSTKMFCEGDAGKAETAFTSGLANGFEVMAADNTITLTEGKTVLVFTRE